MNALLRCGVQGLSAAETALIRTLFKLYNHSASDFRWALVDAPPYDAILVDSNADHTAAVQGRQTAKAILTVGSATLTALPNTLTRPLRSEMLEAWLLQTQRQFFPEAGSTARVKAQPPAANATRLTDGDAYRLMRWPPAAMLRNDPSLIRMATALSRRPIKLSELARVSQQAVETVHTFVSALHNAGLLEHNTPAHAWRYSKQEDSAPRAAPPQKVERSLISRIRLRLGL